ncbi:LOW QUALITY PROTEIN: FERM, ARHGEF and pleckstrin domain-containing protein 2 [Alosa sapidissima]|uniref:LOW QUALITY PROTEIN: FERM, ARHGEF and pleckstrin domain-containing protein 2 n=1 Tax=Alosa sapidissima TaxID=34773 RepID=UPI001C09CEF2|nr:LOW QUALITY PROTEIN: FERM, ARHGEF and pleckstrin domain-containing protein 2 [Alosa sapidissima]
MGEIEGTYRTLQTPGTRLGAQFNAGISTLEPGQSLSTAMGSGGKAHSRGLQLRVLGLDDAQEFYDLETKADGQALLTEVYRRCNLIESDYFGLEFQNMQMNWVWLEPTKLVVKQVRRPVNTLFRLSVKFFPPDPGQLQEEYTRYLFSLQMKRDLIEGRLTCTENTGALLASHLVQSEIGDYDDVADREYLKMNKLLPYQERVQEKIMELHRRHLGQTPAESDFQVLEIARKLEMYGVRFHPAADREGTKINLSVAHMGLQVFQGITKINTFNWSKIRKLSFKRKRFLIKLHPEVHGPHQDTLEFLMASRDQCKIFWKNCVEHHSFFRLYDQPQPKAKAILFSRGSSFRYSGRTQKQLVEYVRDSGARRTPYQRRNSKIRMSARSLAADFPKQSLSFNDSLRLPGSPASATVSFHSLPTSGGSPLRVDHQTQLQQTHHSQSAFAQGQQLQFQQQQPARPPSPPKEDPVKAATSPPSHYAFQGATSNRVTAGDCGPSFVCVESSLSYPLQHISQNGNEDSGEWAGGRGVSGRAGGGGGGGVGGVSSVGVGERKGVLTPEAFEAELLRGRQPLPAASSPGRYPLAGTHLQVSEEYIDDDPAEMSFYAGGAEAYSFGFDEKAGRFAYLEEEEEEEGLGREVNGEGSIDQAMSDDYGLGLEDLSGSGLPYGVMSSRGRSETSSLVNNRSECSSLDPLPLGSAGDSLSLSFPLGLAGGPDSSSSLRLPGSENLSEASSMVNFPACSVRSGASSAVQFGELVEQLEQLSYPPTATEGSDNASSASDSDWGSDAGLPPEQNLFYANPLVGGGTGVEGFLLECHNLRALGMGEPPGTSHLKIPNAQSPPQALTTIHSVHTHPCLDPPLEFTKLTPSTLCPTQLTPSTLCPTLLPPPPSAPPISPPPPSAPPSYPPSPFKPELYVSVKYAVRERVYSSTMDSPLLSPFSPKGPLCMSPSFQMSTLSLPGQAPSPLQSPILSEVGSARLDEEDEGRRKRYPTDKAYFIAKEILTTERTYLKDLEVITVWFRSAVIKENAMPEGLMTLLFSNIDPIYEFHRGFLKEIDQRLALWEGRSNAHVKGDYQRIGDVMLRNMSALKEFTSYLQKHDEVLTELEKATKRLKKLETVYKEFELQKVCYLPLNTFLLKPIQRLMHYKLILERLCKHYTPEHRDHDDCKEALKDVAEIAAQLQSSLIRLENFQKLTELQRDLIGIENLTAPGREFIREGCLYKLTKKGLQQRMFFLFSDMLLYTSKGVTATNQFKVHGQLPLHGMIAEESENEWSVPHCFTIYSAQRTIVVAASPGSPELGERWSSDEVSLEQESEDDMNSSHSSLDKQTHHRANTTMHVCWHRNTGVSMSDHSLAVENQLSGYLLRKFKNSNGWQKLWVVFTNFCLFFYKTHQDDFPLASLPLLGYTVSTPGETDSIHKEYVFKLQFKSHVYFFRAESEYTFERWMEVIKSAASSTGRMSLLIPKGPTEMNGN